MSATTGPVVAMGGLALINQTIFNGQPIDWRIPLATGLAAGGFALAERVWPEGAAILAWTGLLTVIIARMDPKQPSVAENALSWWNKGAGKS